MRYIALDRNGDIKSLGDHESFSEADEKTCLPWNSVGVDAVWIWDEESAKEIAEQIKYTLDTKT